MSQYEDRIEMLGAIEANTVIASAAIMGVIALANGLSAAGMLGRDAIDRIADFMLQAVENGGVEPAITAALADRMDAQFSALRRKLD